MAPITIPQVEPNDPLRSEIHGERRPARTSAQASARIRFELAWASSIARHIDSLVAVGLDLGRDILPPELVTDLMDRPRGHRAEHAFAPGELVPAWRPELAVSRHERRFSRRFAGRVHIQPRLGRFYPRGIFEEIEDISGQDRRPCRIVALDDDKLDADLNHPLAERRLRLAATIESIQSRSAEHGRPGIDISRLVTAGGPGMQTRWRDLPTDFWSGHPFARRDERADAEFYATARLVDHIDRTAIAVIAALYGRLIPAGARILDLMSSWHSHLPEHPAARAVTGLGMNAEELAANPVLAERIVQDLNAEPGLPFGDGAFDAVICTVSVEYLTRPIAVFREVARVLAPGGLFIVTFSNRWFPPKAILIWEELHEWERPGLVLEYFLASEGFGDLETWSLRGLPRPADDQYAGRLALSDPVHAVWGRKT